MNLAGDMITLRSRLDIQLERFADLHRLLNASRSRMLRTIADFEEQYLNPRLNAEGKTSTPQSEVKRGFDTNLSQLFNELEFDTYNDLNILARSVSEMANDVSEIQSQFDDLFGGIQRESQQLQKLSRQLRQEVSRARMVPAGQLYGLLRRLLRDQDDKAYKLETSGETVEFDNMILEGVADPLVHLIRNAIVHGIEPQEERLAKGKAATGTISLRAFHRGNHVYLEVEDDGAGLDLEALKRQAVAKGFKRQDEIETMSHEEACQLIFIPGLSTARSVTTEAGRGVGMDAVAASVRRLKGELQMQTEKDLGTLFTLKLPLTLLISEALMVELAGHRFAFAAELVETLRSVSAKEILNHENKHYLWFAGERIPVYDLRKVLALGPSLEQDEVTLVITYSEGQRLAFQVDALAELEEVVVRGLSQDLSALYYLSSATISAEGEVIALLEPSGLARLAQQESQVTQMREATPHETQARRLLLVDDSVSVRRVVSKMLERADYEVATAADGQAALELFIQGERFDAVLTDLEMPRMNGYELIEELRHRPDTSRTPIIVMTTRAGEKHRNLAFEIGATDYFSKPINDIQLLARLSSVFELVI
jgi:chemosensory pili system protein ChpA (sensor histidine kinase/response regulator)